MFVIICTLSYIILSHVFVFFLFYLIQFLSSCLCVVAWWLLYLFNLLFIIHLFRYFGCISNITDHNDIPKARSCVCVFITEVPISTGQTTIPASNAYLLSTDCSLRQQHRLDKFRQQPSRNRLILYLQVAGSWSILWPQFVQIVPTVFLLTIECDHRILTPSIKPGIRQQQHGWDHRQHVSLHTIPST